MTALARIASWAAAAGVAAVLVPRPDAVFPVGAAGAVPGAVAGVVLFAALGRSWTARIRTKGARLAVRAAYVSARAAYEEAVWRLCLLGLLSAAFGRPAGLLLVTAAFAASHWPRQGRAATVHLLTGAVFGGLFLLTGSFATAVAAHAAYNTLLAATCPDSTLGGAAMPPYDPLDAPAG